MGYSFGGPKPTHMVLAGPDATDQQVQQVRDMIERTGFPVILPAGWQVQSIEPVGFVVPAVKTIDINESPPAWVPAFLGGLLVGVLAVLWILVLGGIIR